MIGINYHFIKIKLKLTSGQIQNQLKNDTKNFMGKYKCEFIPFVVLNVIFDILLTKDHYYHIFKLIFE